MCLARPAAGRLSVKILVGTIAMSSFYLGSVIVGCGPWVRNSSKERSSSRPNFEAKNVRFLKEKSSIPLPTVVAD